MLHIDLTSAKSPLIVTNGTKQDFNIGSIGINSYINSMDLQSSVENEVINIQIGNYSSIAYNVLALVNRNHDYMSITTSSAAIFDFKNKKIKQKGQILIGNDVWIGNNVILLSGIKIGNGAVIGAGAVVSKDIPPYAVAVGNPIRIIKYRFSEEQIEKLQRIKWWNWDSNRIHENREWFHEGGKEFTNNFYVKPVSPNEITMNVKTNSILFYPDFSDTYPVWEKIIIEYINKFTDKDDVTLVLRIPQSNDFEVQVNLISELVCGKEHLPDILVFNDIIEDERSIFKRVKYFITTRSIKTIEFVEMADEFNVKILSGVDIPVFV
jgi:virginiamycin A acetyltransferase